MTFGDCTQHRLRIKKENGALPAMTQIPEEPAQAQSYASPLGCARECFETCLAHGNRTKGGLREWPRIGNSSSKPLWFVAWALVPSRTHKLLGSLASPSDSSGNLLKKYAIETPLPYDRDASEATARPARAMHQWPQHVMTGSARIRRKARTRPEMRRSQKQNSTARSHELTCSDA